MWRGMTHPGFLEADSLTFFDVFLLIRWVPLTPSLCFFVTGEAKGWSS